MVAGGRNTSPCTNFHPVSSASSSAVSSLYLKRIREKGEEKGEKKGEKKRKGVSENNKVSFHTYNSSSTTAKKQRGEEGKNK